MPRQSPFTTVASRLAHLARHRGADLHVHTNASDGEYTPSQVVAQARQADLAAVAITDHDTRHGVAEAHAAAAGAIEIISGVEITAEFAGREVHLLGLFLPPGETELDEELARLRNRRRTRFHEYIAALAARGIIIPEDRVYQAAETSHSLGRRHVAALLLAAGYARSRHEAFQRVLGPVSGLIGKLLIPVERAIRLVRDAGGIASLAHPHPELTEADFRGLAGRGLAALEAMYPWSRNSHAARLRAMAGKVGLAVTGGSDCHGPEPSHRRIGSHTITSDELAALRERIDRPGCVVS